MQDAEEDADAYARRKSDMALQKSKAMQNARNPWAKYEYLFCALLWSNCAHTMVLRRYTRKAPKNLRQAKLTTASACNLVFDMYERKISDDAIDDSQSNARAPLPNYVKEYFLQKFGLPTMCERYGPFAIVLICFTVVPHSYLYKLVETVHQHVAQSTRLRVFAVLVGVYDGDSASYSPRLCDFFLHLLSNTIVNFNAAFLRNRK